ncbi:MAG: hypothetical protein WBV94_14310 [Blastocatellia bacterium]
MKNPLSGNPYHRVRPGSARCEAVVSSAQHFGDAQALFDTENSRKRNIQCIVSNPFAVAQHVDQYFRASFA